MSKLKKVIAMLLVTALMVPAVAVSAATTPSVTKTKIEAATIIIENTNVVYNGKDQSVKITLIVNGKELTAGTDYVVEGAAKKNAGTHALEVKIVGKGLYEGTITRKVTLKIAKKAQKVKNTKAKTVKYKKLKKKAQTIKLKVKSTGSGKLVYKSTSKKIKVNKKGKVIVAKGTKKGTYIIKVYAKKTANEKKSATKKVKIVVK